MRIELTNQKKIQEALSRYPTSSRRNFRRASERSGRMVERFAKRTAPVDQGSLRQSIGTNVSGISAEVVAGAKYAPFVEFGRKPGTQPPIQNLERWANKRGIDPFVVARSIGRYGTKAQPFMHPALEKNRRNIIIEFEQALRKTIDEL